MAKRYIFYDKYEKTKKRLFLLFLVMTFVLIGAGLGILKLSNMKTMNMGIETIYEDRVMPLQQLKMVSDLYGINIVDTAHKVLNGNISWHNGRKNIDETTKRIPKMWNEYMKTYLVDKEKMAVNELAPLFVRADNASAKLRKIFQNEDSGALAEFVKKELYQNIEPVTHQIDTLFYMQIGIAKDIRDKENLRYKFSSRVGMVSIAVSLILSLIVAFQWKRWRALRDSL